MKAKATGRRSRFVRDARPAHLMLQPRDHLIMRLCHDYRVLDRPLIQALAGFGCAVRANVRLRSLFDHRFLARRFLPVLTGPAQALYHLGPAGVPLVAQDLGHDPTLVRRRIRADLSMAELFLAHTLAVSRARAAFTLALNHSPGMELESWRDSADLARGDNHRPSLVPDGHFLYRDGERRFACFLEADRGTESLRRIQEKARRYLDYGLSGGHMADFGLRFFRVARLTEKMFWFALEEDLAPERAFGPVWLRPREEERIPLREA